MYVCVYAHAYMFPACKLVCIRTHEAIHEFKRTLRHTTAQVLLHAWSVSLNVHAHTYKATCDMHAYESYTHNMKVLLQC